VKAGLDRARALAKTARADYAKHKHAAEATVARWEWATKPRFHPAPAHFETLQLSRGKALAAEPSEWKAGQAHEGFDREGRIVVSRERTAVRGDSYETFYFYAPDGIAQLHYTAGGGFIHAGWHTLKNGRVVASDSLSQLGGSSREYEYDTHGRVTRCVAHGVHADKPWEQTFEYDHADDRLERVWSVQPDGRRVVHWQRRKR
jgi:hypothetical protein